MPVNEATVQSGWKPRPAVLAGIALAGLIVLTFFPVLTFEFMGYDARSQVVDNPLVRDFTLDNVWRICTSRCVTSYRPVRTLTYMLDCQLWGQHAGGFKFTNCLFHTANTLLLFWLSLRLLRDPTEIRGDSHPWRDVAAAGFAAAIYAVHPVVVEAVVWVPGREELLMTMGALGAIHLHMTAWRTNEKGGTTRRAIACHIGATLCCAAASLSNAVAAVIPALITAWDLVYLARPKFWKTLQGTAAMWIIGVATILIKRSEGTVPLVGQPGFFSTDRWLLVANVHWLNLKTLCWPANLGFDYPPVKPASPLDTQVLLGVIAIGLALLALRLVRRQKAIQFGLLWFVLALAPTSQIMIHHIHRADRFLYLPLAGIVLALAAASRPREIAVCRRAAIARRLALGMVVVLALETLATRQVWTWQNEITACENSLKLKPDDPIARCALGDRLVIHGQYRRAMEVYEEARRLHPNDARIHSNFAWLLATCRQSELRNHELAEAMAMRACELTHWKAPEQLQILAEVHLNAAKDAAARGEGDRAAELLKKAVDETLRLAILLQSGSREKLKDPGEAVRLAEQACRLARQPDSTQLGMLAEVYEIAGLPEQAISTLERAVEKSQAEGNEVQSDRLKAQLARCRNAGD